MMHLVEIETKLRKDGVNQIPDIRYPLDEHYVPHFYINEFNNVVVDLENFIVRFKEIGENLQAISTYYLFEILEVEK